MVGDLKKDDSILIKNCKELGIQGGLPLNRIQGNVNGKPTKINLARCATKSKKLKTGFLRFEIHSTETNDETILYWKKHTN